MLYKHNGFWRLQFLGFRVIRFPSLTIERFICLTVIFLPDARADADEDGCARKLPRSESSLRVKKAEKWRKRKMPEATLIKKGGAAPKKYYIKLEKSMADALEEYFRCHPQEEHARKVFDNYNTIIKTDPFLAPLLLDAAIVFFFAGVNFAMQHPDKVSFREP